MADSVEDRVGQQLGNYRLLRQLRQENAADVYLGEHIFLKTQAAIKVLPGQLSQNALEAFLSETSRIARLKHPNILRVLEFGVEGKTAFLVTDYTTNGSLRQLYPRGSQVPPPTIASYVRQIAAALQYIHDQGLVYRGVRPENMLLGPQDRILLSDFSPTIDTLDEAAGHHDRRSEDAKTEELVYTAPEQRSGQPEAASDQYALGVTVYEWLSGKFPSNSNEHPLIATIPLANIQGVPPSLLQVLTIALAQEPQRRFATVTAFARAVGQILEPPQLQSAVPRKDDGGTAESSQVHTLPPPDRRRTRSRAFGGIAIGLLLLVLLLSVGLISYNAAIFPFARQTNPAASATQAARTALARGTQQAVATFTAQSTREIYTATTSGSPVLNDPLTNRSTSTWRSVQGKNYACLFTSGTYHMQIASASTYLNCLDQKPSVHNFAFEVEMSVIKGDGGGIIFRSDDSQANFYVFRTASSGTQSYFSFLAYVTSGTTTSIKYIQETVSQIDAHAFNLITVIGYEDTFYFYINKMFLMKAQDTTLTKGSMGMYAWNGDKGATEVAFRNARIWKLEG
jgi:serine/threonine protein kinase